MTTKTNSLKKQINFFLKQLGSTKQEVVDNLIWLDCKKEGSSCPVEVYLKEAFPELGVEVGTHNFTFPVPFESLFRQEQGKLPRSVQSFIHEFDSYAYPELLEE